MQIQKRIFLSLVMLNSVFVGAAELATTKVRAMGSADIHVAEGVVEAVQQSAISAQVSGRITQLTVKAGDRVQKGQLLVKISG